MAETSPDSAAGSAAARPGFLKRWRNTIFSTADHMWLLVLWAVSTPIFIHYLGAEAFGVWILINAVIGFGGVLSFGFGEATVRYVALYNGQNRPEDIRRIIDTTLAIYVAIGLLSALALGACADLIAARLFSLEGAAAQEAATALVLAGVALLITSYLKTYEAVINGFERFDLTARVGMATRSFIILSNVLMVMLGYELVALIAVAVLGLAAQAVAYFILCRRDFVPALKVFSLPDWRTLQEIAGFGFQTWLQILAGALNTLADRFLVAALLGPAAAGVYAICLQLAQQIQLLLTRGLAFLMPQTSRAGVAAQDDPGAMIAAYHNGTTLVLLLAGAIALPMYVLSHQVLMVWIGPEYALAGAAALRVVVVYFAILGAAVPVHFLLNGAGRPGWNTLATLIHGVVGLACAAALLPGLELPGVGLGRAAALPAYGIMFWAMHRYLFAGRGLRVSLIMLGWLAVLGLTAHGLLRTLSPNIPATIWAVLGAGLLLAVLGGLLALIPFLVARRNRRLSQAD